MIKYFPDGKLTVDKVKYQYKILLNLSIMFMLFALIALDKMLT